MEPSDGQLNWIFFAAYAKPTSMRRAIAERLARTDHVVIVDRPVSVIREKQIPPLQERCVPVADSRNSYHYRPIHYPEGFPVARRVFAALNCHLLKQELDRLLPADGKRIACYDSPTQDNLPKSLGEQTSVYLAIDDRTLTVTGEPIKGELEAEQRLLGKVDGVICISEPLAGILRSRTPRGYVLPIHILPNGYDERLFNTEKECNEPEFLKQVPRPRVLVSGHVSERIDWEGIARASELRPQWSWVVVGPADTGMPKKIMDMLGTRGFYHPQIELTEVPAWILHCDACAVPYRLNAFTNASNPLKAIEYLAMGAPVLSTRIPSLGRFADVIEWLEEGDGTSYASALDRCCTLDGEPSRREARLRAVKEDSWGARVNKFREMVPNANP
jgi:glycosyltransferase involved in cell wall biosynthesis